jgi:hypothetical protein
MYHFSAGLEQLRIVAPRGISKTISSDGEQKDKQTAELIRRIEKLESAQRPKPN